MTGNRNIFGYNPEGLVCPECGSTSIEVYQVIYQKDGPGFVECNSCGKKLRVSNCYPGVSAQLKSKDIKSVV